MSALREILVAFGVTFDTKPLEHGQHKIHDLFGEVKELGKLLAEAFVVKEIFEFTMHAAEAAEQLEHTAQATGLSTDELQAWQLGAAEAGVEGGEFTMALRRLSSALAGGEDGAGTQAKLLKKWGIEAKDAAGHTQGLAEVLPQIAEHFKGMADGPEKSAKATELFGRQGARLIPLLNKGAEGVKELKKDLEELGGGFDPEFIEESSKVIEQTKRLDVAWTSAKVKVLGFLLPALEWAVRGLIKVSQAFQVLAKNTNIVQAGLAVFAAFAIAKAAALVVAWWHVLAPFLAWVAVIALIVLVVDDLITAWQGGDSVIGRILDKLWGPGSTRKVVAWCRETLDAFSTFFSDLSERPAEFEENWKRTSQSIQNDINSVLGPTLGGIVNAWLAEWGVLIDGLTGGWQNFLDKSSAVWDGIVLAFKIAWTEIKFFGLGIVAELDDAVTKLLNKIPGGLGAGLAGSGTAASDIERLHTQAKTALAAEGDAVGARLTAPAQGLVSTTVPVVVNVHGNADAGTAAKVGAAAQTGALKGARRAAHASLVRKPD